MKILKLPNGCICILISKINKTALKLVKMQLNTLKWWEFKHYHAE